MRIRKVKQNTRQIQSFKIKQEVKITEKVKQATLPLSLTHTHTKSPPKNKTGTPTLSKTQIITKQ